MMLTTKEFADLCSASKKTIIHYDRIGLLRPIKLEGKNRLYSPKQVLVFQKIKLLKSLGLTLKESKKYLASDKVLLKLFKERKKSLENLKESIEKRVEKTQEFISSLKQGKGLISPKFKTVKPYSFYGIDKVGRYVDIDKHQKEIFKKVGSKNTGLTVFYNQKYSPDKSQMTTGVLADIKKLKEIKGVKIIKTPQYKTVYYVHVGPYSYMSYIWQFMDKFVAENKLKRHHKLAVREFYRVGPLSEKNEDNFVTELQIPIM